MADKIPCSSIDIAMIAYNEAEIIAKSLVPLLEAGFDSFVILDMNSTDGTVDIARDILGDKCRIVSIPRKYLIENGYAEARNICASFCERPWTLFVDADEVLLSGVENGSVLIEQVGTNQTIFAIARDNLALDPADPNKIYVKSSEHHNRLYQQKFWQRWQGYIHEELFCGGVSGHSYNGHSALKFDHYSELKGTKDADRKGGLYALMLVRAYNFPAIQVGTNSWWYDTYVPEHLPTLTIRAETFAKLENIPKSFYDDTSSAATETSVSDMIKTFTAATSAEVVVDCPDVRSVHSMQCDQWLGSPARALWYEWNHPGERSRTLSSIVNDARIFHWQHFVKPGEVAIDIGGHSGDTAIPMGLFGYDKSTHRKGHVLVVEPNPAVIPILDCNLAINTHIANFHSIPAAVTAQDVDEIELADHGNSQCNGGVLEPGLSADVGRKLREVAEFRYKAPGISMKTLFRSAKSLSNGQPIGFVKLDCAGYDKEIIRPCRELFAEDKPVLFVEWFDWFEAEDDADLFAVIDSLDYAPFNPVTLEPSALDRPISDLLCFHKTLLASDGTLRI